MTQRLRVKQERFCLEYFKTGNATNAAIAAGYAPKFVAYNTTKILNSNKIIQRLKELGSKAESESIATVAERKQILTEILRSKLTDFMELGQDGSWVNIGPETPNSRAIQEIHSRTEYDEDGSHPTVHTSVKLHDPMKAIAELNKMEKIYETTTVLNVDNRQITFQVVGEGTKSLMKRIASGERTEPLEIDADIRPECAILSGQDETPGA
jgi:phage terminase small subunit